MNHLADYQACLRKLVEALEAAGDQKLAARTRPLTDRDDAALLAFLVSNDLWGGAGSIADEAGLATTPQLKRDVEVALIELGELQMKSGLTNVRTAMWTSAFKEWQQKRS